MKDKLSSYKAFGHDLIAWQMSFKMLFIIGCFLSVVYLLALMVTAHLFLGAERVGQVRTWATAKAISPFLPEHRLTLTIHGKSLTAPAVEFAGSPTLGKWIRADLWRLLFAATVPLPVFLFFPKILARYKAKEQRRIQPRYIDGARLLSPADFKTQIEGKYRKTYVPFGGWYDSHKTFHQIRLPVEVENAHIGIFGGLRSGKTVMISQMLHALRQRGDIALVLDQKGDFTENFYDREKDHILNVLDERCVPWSFWHDLQIDNPLLRRAEIEAVAAGLIPAAKESTEQFFHDAARDVLAGILTWLDRQKEYTYAQLWDAINQSRQTMAARLAEINHRGHIYISEAGKQSQGVISVVMQYCRIFEFATVLDDDSKEKFRIEDWLNHGKGYIYLTNYDSIRDTLRPMLSLFVNFLAKKILTADENLFGRRIWLFLDEFGSLHKLDTLIDILTLGGSKGVCVILATQDRGQVEEIYGPNLTDAIFNSCNSWAALRCKDSATARLIVDRVGEWRFERQEESVTDRFDDGGDSINISKRIIREKLLLDTNIMGQSKLQAYIHVDGCDFAQVDIEKRFFDPRCPAFILRSGVDLPAEVRIQAQPAGNDNIGINDYHAEVGI